MSIVHGVMSMDGSAGWREVDQLMGVGGGMERHRRGPCGRRQGIGMANADNSSIVSSSSQASRRFHH